MKVSVPGSRPRPRRHYGLLLEDDGLRRRGPLPAFGVLAVVAALATVFPRIGVTTVTLLAMAYVLYLVTVTSTRRTSVAGLGLQAVAHGNRPGVAPPALTCPPTGSSRSR